MPDNKKDGRKPDLTINANTGEIFFGDESMIERLRDLEREISRTDAVVAKCQDALKDAKAERDAAIGALRDAVRDQKPLPLLDELPAESPADKPPE
jgi:hypothetical protein